MQILRRRIKECSKVVLASFYQENSNLLPIYPVFGCALDTESVQKPYWRFLTVKWAIQSVGIFIVTMSRDKSGSGTCQVCEKSLVSQKCICRSCLQNPTQELGELYAKRRELIHRSNELQESLRVLMERQVGLQLRHVIF